jgi:DNA-binding CsgD family transcriptional regulator
VQEGSRINARANRIKAAYGRILIRPLGLTRTPREPIVALLCGLLLAFVFVLEVLTPHAVVGALALLPVVAAVWVLSGRLAAVVAFVAVVLFGLTVMLEPGNRLTVVIVGSATLVTALAARLYATSLATLLSAPRQQRSGVATTTSITLGGLGGRSHGTETLTRRELEVARLAAQGYTSAEIGSHLQIGERTVESHLASTYTKLGIRSRRELIRMTATLGE